MGSLSYGVELTLRSLTVPLFLGARWVSQRGEFVFDEVPTPPKNWSVFAKLLLDEAFFVSELLSATVIFDPTIRERTAAGVKDSLDFMRDHGWLEKPTRYHQSPPPLLRPEISQARDRGVPYMHLQFESGYEPHMNEPGRERWLAYKKNTIAHAYVLQHDDGPRPWIVGIHGFRMGTPMINFTAFKAQWLHEVVGLNVAFPVLPLHGARKYGRRGGDGFFAGDFVDTLHAQSQALWDVRRLLSWIRAQDENAKIALYGLSLGGFTTALTTGFEKDLDCVIAGIPATDFAALARWNVPKSLRRLAERQGTGLITEDIEKLLSVVSPLNFKPKVKHENLFVFAGANDRLAPPDHARNLWRHWGRNHIEWYEGGHVSFMFEAKVQNLILRALHKTGMIDADTARYAQASLHP